MGFVIEIVPFRKEYINDAAALFARGLRTLCETVPGMPDRLAAPGIAAQRLDEHLSRNDGVVALKNGRFAGYLTWFLVDNFRGSQHLGEYCPEWGHGTNEEQPVEIYQALYRAASRQWAEAHCQVHALTLLSHNRPAIEAWFWNGFGLIVLDAVRPLRGLDTSPRTGPEVRKATPADVPALVELDAEHWRHYTQPPIFMPAHKSQDAEAALASITGQGNRVWLACDKGKPTAFIRFTGGGHDGIDSLDSPATVGISGAYVRPAYRGRGAVTAVLDAGLQEYAKQGYSCCGVTFESFNPEAAAFWPKYFHPVAYSLLRTPEDQRLGIGR
jgi:GNAT superfamily N-acetyltransferase